jgi:hypothetical protein
MTLSLRIDKGVSVLKLHVMSRSSGLRGRGLSHFVSSTICLKLVSFFSEAGHWAAPAIRCSTLAAVRWALLFIA